MLNAWFNLGNDVKESLEGMQIDVENQTLLFWVIQMAYISLIISASEKSLFVLDVLFLNNSHCQEIRLSPNNTEKLGM